MDRRKIARLGALVSAVVLVTVLVQPHIAVLLTEPLTRLWWLIDSLPQRLTWIVLAVLGFVLVIALGGRSRFPAQESTPSPSSACTEVERLTKLIELSDHSIWARDVLGRRLCETAAGLRALREGVHRDQVREEVITGRWPSTQGVADVLRSPQQEGDTNYVRRLAGALESLERYAREGDL